MNSSPPAIHKQAKHLISGLISFCFVLFFSAASADGGAFNVGVQLEPPNLDPTAGAAAAIDEIVYANIFEGLTRIQEDGTVAPALASDWAISDDGRIYEFTLREGVRFHDGTLFDADDVVFTFDRARSETSANAQKLIWQAIEQVEALSAQQVRFTLKEPLGAFLTYLGWGDAVIVAPETAGSNAINPVGTGPFRFHRWRRGALVTLVRNADYWDVQPALEQINFIFIPDPTAAFAALMAGDVDGFPNYPAAENLDLISRQAQLQTVFGTGEGEIILAINNAKPHFADKRVRQAFSHAIDRQAVIDAALFGNGVPIGSHFPPHHPSYVDLTDQYSYDPDKARALLAEAGLSKGFTVDLALPPPAYARRSGEVIAAQLAAIGIDVRIRNIEWAQWLDQVFANKAYDLTIVAHTEPLDIDIYARDDYYFGYSNPNFKAVISALHSEIDPTKRDELFKQAQRIISDDAVNVFLAQSPKIGVWSKNVSGVWANAPVQANDFTDARNSGRALASLNQQSTNNLPVFAITLAAVAMIVGIVLTLAKASPAYIAGRVSSLFLSLFAATIIVFLLIEIAPGDPAAFMMGLNADPESVAALRQEFGLDRPVLVRYFSWVGGLIAGDFGISYTYRVPVAELIRERLLVSLPLAFLAFLLSTAIAIPAGVAAAAWRRRVRGRVLLTTAQAGIAIPNFWLAILLVMIFSVSLRWFSAGGFPGWDAGAGPALKALLLPAIALAVPQAAILTQVMRSSMIETLSEDYIRTARAKGVSRSRTLRNHALRNALIPVLTILGLQFAFLLAGGVIIENVFYLPGLGRLVFQAIAQRDLIVVKNIVIILVFATIMAAFIIDLAYSIVDPRLRRTAQS